MYFLTVGPETPVAAAMPLTDSPLLALLLISSTLSTPIIDTVNVFFANRANGSAPSAQTHFHQSRKRAFAASG